MRTAAAALVLALGAATSPQAQTQLDINAAANRAFQKADRELNAVYKQITLRLAPANTAKLVKAQRSWLQFRDAECDFEATSVDGGSAKPMIYSSCLEKLTSQRTQALRAITLDCREGDLACLLVRK